MKDKKKKVEKYDPTCAELVRFAYDYKKRNPKNKKST